MGTAMSPLRCALVGAALLQAAAAGLLMGNRSTAKNILGNDNPMADIEDLIHGGPILSIASDVVVPGFPSPSKDFMAAQSATPAMKKAAHKKVEDLEGLIKNGDTAGMTKDQMATTEAHLAIAQAKEAAMDPNMKAHGNFDVVLNMASQGWPVVENDKPAPLNVPHHFASALPKGASRGNQLTGWREKRWMPFSVKYKNAFGGEVLKFVFQATFRYGGTVDGNGLYLDQVRIDAPTDGSGLYLEDNIHFHCLAKPQEPSNVGSDAHPMAGLEVHVRWSAMDRSGQTSHMCKLLFRGDGSTKSNGCSVVDNYDKTTLTKCILCVYR